MNTLKTCTKCGQTKPTTQYHKNRNCSDGLQYHCKACNRACVVAWRRAHPDRKRSQDVAYRQRHPDKPRVAKQRRRSRKLGAEGTHAAADIERIRVAQGGRCCYCGAETKLTVDHIVPLSRGGTNWPDNIALACQRCNDSKGAKLLDEWLPA